MTVTPGSPQLRSQYLSFALGGEEFAVDILRVREIIEYGPLTRVPAMPASVRGVINLRGRVVPVVDLAARFGLREREITRRSCIVMLELTVEDAAVVVGVIADAVSQVLDLAATEIEPAPSFGTSVDTRFILGMAEAGSRFVILLDIDRVLDAAELLADATAA